MNDKTDDNKPDDAAPKTGPRTIKLSRPLDTHKGKVNSITLKEPSAGLLLRIGLPYRQIGAMDPGKQRTLEFDFIPDRMAIYIEEMSGIDRLTLEGITAADMHQVMLTVFEMVQPAGSL